MNRDTIKKSVEEENIIPKIDWDAVEKGDPRARRWLGFLKGADIKRWRDQRVSDLLKKHK